MCVFFCMKFKFSLFRLITLNHKNGFINVRISEVNYSEKNTYTFSRKISQKIQRKSKKKSVKNPEKSQIPYAIRRSNFPLDSIIYSRETCEKTQGNFSISPFYSNILDGEDESAMLSPGHIFNMSEIDQTMAMHPKATSLS